jgi:hypothetical protein
MDGSFGGSKTGWLTRVRLLCIFKLVFLTYFYRSIMTDRLSWLRRLKLTSVHGSRGLTPFSFGRSIRRGKPVASPKSVLPRQAPNVLCLHSYSIVSSSTSCVPKFIGSRFLSEYRVDNPSVTGPELGKQGGSAWRQLPQTKKDVCGICTDSPGIMSQLEN